MQMPFLSFHKKPFVAILFFVSLVLISATAHAYAGKWELTSPDGKILVSIESAEELKWSVRFNNDVILIPSAIGMQFSNGINAGNSPSVKSVKRASVNKMIEAVVPVKSKLIPDLYNEVRVNFKEGYSVVFRAYNDGVAYRFETSFRDEKLQVKNEKADLNFAEDQRVFWPIETDKEFQSHYESLYKDSVLSAFNEQQHGALPFLVKTKAGTNLLVSESDLYDYPNLFLKGTGGPALRSTFPKVILDKVPFRDRGYRITKLADYIAETKGTRVYPWRSIAICPQAKDLLENNLTFKLASENTLPDTKWIKPGKVAWDWWNANNIYGVDFKAGLNTETYKYYVDFASAYGLEYVILDEGWSITTTNVLQARKEIDLPALIRYATSKNVGIILWTLWNPLDDNMDAILDQFAKWGVKGIKVDFMARADQYMVNYYERVAVAAAKRKLLVDLHGAYKPVGLNRKYPNVLSYEGVRGLENDKWSEDITPKHDVTLPFIRMAAGPMDYTPGAMINAGRSNFRIVFTEPMSQGTRAHQAAMYVVYESPLQMLADNPSNYLKEPVFTKYISKMPTTWDTTIAIQGEPGEFVAVARRKETQWFVGAMTNWSPRKLTLDLSFLPPGQKYSMEVLEDGPNAMQHAADYKISHRIVSAGEKVEISMSSGGGWSATLSPSDK
ncbi:glycoside hydrolase family 97 protein [Terrimonas sp. NA20]|uniref:Glycoside hydrolase family 97 protein n=1 Tax=Terrimonas ginsenosidimutans TaxID=2908004 RepID=A0ABS9KME2_9BACT|nr:glycoside hydrolase family 97 protein [Terrimonas ginsenosidimutans]MCG2613486.1 glycoside hydrolase family 97 protein [Terrimonas ginsenosidimutans]